MTTVELETAFAWMCPDCGTTNTELPVTGELPDNEFLEYCDMVAPADAVSIPEKGDDFELEAIINRVVFQPKFVKCSSCGTSHQTEIPFDEDDGEGDE